MLKNELVAIIAKKTHGLHKETVALVLDALADTVTRELSAGRDVTLPGMGKLKVVVRAGRTGRNPHTGAPLEIPQKRVVKFVPAKRLSETVDPT